jgi:hypothetical protein
MCDFGMSHFTGNGPAFYGEATASWSQRVQAFIAYFRANLDCRLHKMIIVAIFDA